MSFLFATMLYQLQALRLRRVRDRRRRILRRGLAGPLESFFAASPRGLFFVVGEQHNLAGRKRGSTGGERWRNLQAPS